MSKLIPYGRQTIEKEDIDAVVSVLVENKYLTTGPRISEFEQKVAEFSNAKYAVAVNNGTSALHCAVNALGITSGDEVIVTSISFVASSNCVIYEGATPVFADIDPRTMNIDPNKIENLITSNTKAIIVVHFAGQLCDMEKIKYIANQHNLKIIEDAAHAIGTVGVGKYGDLTTFSFHPVKNMTTGEGGMIITNDETYYQKMLTFRSHGISSSYKEREVKKSHSYDMVSLGYNLRITDLQCALGLSQLKRLPIWVQIRKTLAKIYDDAFKSHINLFEPLKQLQDSTYHIYIIKLKLENLSADRDTIFKALKDNNIGVNVHYMPIYLHTYYKSLGIKGNCPNAEKVYTQIITLPIYPTLSDEDIRRVIDTVISVITSYKNDIFIP